MIHKTKSQIINEKNNEKKRVYVYDNENNEVEIIVSLKETVLDLKHKIEEAYNLKKNELLNKNIRRKNAKQRTQTDLKGNETTLAENHIHNETGIYFSVLENRGGAKNS